MSSRNATFSSRIAYQDLRAAVEWLEKAFGFKTTMLATDRDEKVVYAEMTFGNGEIQIGGEWENVKPPGAVKGANTQTLSVRLDGGLDEHCERVRAAGGRIVQEPAEQFHGDRTYRVIDPQGHAWSFYQELRDVTPEEMEAALPGMKIWTPGISGKVNTTADPESILRSAQSVLLVDWPSTKVPRALLEAGLTVFGYSPRHYSKAELIPDPSMAGDAKSVFPLENENEKGYLAFRRLASPPARVNIVSVYRPAGELPGIIETQALPLGATTIWLQRPLESDEERRLVQKYGLLLVESCDIAQAAHVLRRHKS
jgi:uncharacterized glyoxalase superfamily protein PhnB